MTRNINKYNSISNHLNIELSVINENYFPKYLGGSKARKIIPILEKAKSENCNALVSCGSANSNHARVVALAAVELGWKCHLIIHDIEDYSKANLQLMKMSGAKLTFCRLDEVAKLMDDAMDDFKQQALNPFYIWGGGHCVEGSLAYYNAVFEYKDELTKNPPDYVFVTSGMGGTQAGLHLAFKELLPNTKVIGISIARDKERGTNVVFEEINKLANFLDKEKISKDEVRFLDKWIGESYGKTYPKLFDCISKAANLDGLITDPTYTGKTLTAIFDLVDSGLIEKNAKVLFWHTGGIFNTFEYYKELSK